MNSKLYHLLANPYKISNKNDNIEIDYLDIYIRNKFHNIEPTNFKLLYNNIDNYINNINIDILIIKDVLENIINKIILLFFIYLLLLFIYYYPIYLIWIILLFNVLLIV